MAVLTGDEAAWVRYGSAPLIVTLILPIVIGVILLLKCILNHCCVRKTTTKEEMYGVEGRMTILTNAESSFVVSTQSQSQNQNATVVNTNATTATTATTTLSTNLNHHNFNKSEHTKLVSLKNPSDTAVDVSTNISTTDGDGIHQFTSDSYETVDLTDSLKRTTLHRQLPDLPQIPQQVHNPPRRSSSVLSHDGTSELYATVGELHSTVGEVPNPTAANAAATVEAAINHYSDIKHRQNLKKSVLPSTSRSINITEVSTKSTKSIQNEPTPSSEGDSETYATNHPYAKLKRNTSEHPYARVRTASAGNDEETDTDNYDIPQPYAQTRARAHNSNAGQQSSSNLSQPSASSSGSANLNSNGDATTGPVPPRRVGRQWRRSSHPQVQNNDNQSHFSGDSQDSRGYTSISVREPLSNIRSQVTNTRQYDSHYATVSDDSEEMYAAIEDASDGNYQRIAGEDGDGRHPWMSVNVASPIPERREANSPLPPPPVPPVPNSAAQEVAASSTTSTQPSGTALSQAPLYAQVVKKSKKGKAPVTPTASNASASSQIKETLESSTTAPTTLQAPSVAPTVQQTTTHHHHSKNRHSIMDNSSYKLSYDSTNCETRRWSKADISYSEFEVVRETLFSSSNHSSSPETTPHVPHFDSATRDLNQSQSTDLLDEDNYNVIPDPSSKNESSGRKQSSSKSKSKSQVRKVSDSNNYQEIDQHSNPYQEIGIKKPKETTADHYQIIDSDAQHHVDIYQEIDRDKSTEYEDYDDEEDQFYEKVKPSAKINSPKPMLSPSAAPSDTLDRKHGYEKLKKKVQPTYSNTGDKATLEVISPVTGISDIDDDDEEDAKNDGDSLYERVKYPPYERLKESRDDLADVENETDEGNLYEAIGYSTVKPKQKGVLNPKKVGADEITEGTDGNEFVNVNDSIDFNGEPAATADIDQLYARVDKTKKKKKTSSSKISDSVTISNSSDLVVVKGASSGKRDQEAQSSRKIGSNTSSFPSADDNILTVDYGTQTESPSMQIENADNSIEYI